MCIIKPCEFTQKLYGIQIKNRPIISDGFGFIPYNSQSNGL